MSCVSTRGMIETPPLIIPTENLLTLSPQELIVFEGGSAVLSCSPFYPLEPPVLVTHDFAVVRTSTEPRLSFQDFVTLGRPFLSNRTYTIRDVTRMDNMRRFRCVIGDVQSGEATIMVYGKYVSLM